MRSSSQPLRQRFLVEVDFFSGDIAFGRELYTIDAMNWYAAEQQALQMSVTSVYDNARIPDLRRCATARCQ